MKNMWVNSSKGDTKFVFDVGWVFLGQLVTLVIGFLLGMFIARWLGPYDLGLYRMTFTIYGLVALVATLGIPAALIKFIAEHKADEKRLNQIASCGFTNSLILGLVISIIAFFASTLLADIYNMPELERLIKIVAVIFPFTSFYQSQTGFLTGLRRMKLFAILTVGQGVLQCILVVSFVLLGFGVQGAITGLVLSVVVICFVGFLVLRRYYAFNLGNYTPNTKKILSFGGKIFGANAINQINYHADILLIGYFLTATRVGYYSIAVGLSRFFWIIPQSIQRVTYPAISEYWSKNNLSALNTMVNKTMKYSACILLPLGLAATFFGKDIIPVIYGDEFIPAVSPLLILLVGTVISGATTRSIGGILPAVGRPDLEPKIVGTAAIVNVILNVLLIPKLGIAGAAIATTVSLVIVPFLKLFFIARLNIAKIDFLWYMKTGLIVLAGTLIYFFFGQINHHIMAAAIIAAFLALIWFYLLSRDDKVYFRDLIKNLKSYLPKIF